MQFLQTLKIKIRDWYYLKRFGRTYEDYQYKLYLESKIFHKACDVRTYYYGFKYVIPVDYYKTNPCGFSGYPEFPGTDAFAQRRAVWGIHRVIAVGNKWQFNDIGGRDVCFVACDSDEDAIMLTMMFG